MKSNVLLISIMLLIASQAIAQQGNKDAWKHEKKYYQKEREWQREHDKKMAEHRREAWLKEEEYYRELAQKEREHYRELRKRELEHLEECHSCDHGVYHNSDYYYEDDIYYSRRTRRPISLDAEIVFRNGSIQVQL